METEQLSVKTEEKPSLMQRTRNFVKKKWVNVGLGAIVAGSLLMGSAKSLSAQASAQEEYYQEPYSTTEVYDAQRVQKDTFIAYVYEGDHDWRRDLDFVAEDLQKVNRDGQPLRIAVHEDYDWTNANVINEVRERINNPEQYPWIEMRGKFWPASPYSRNDGALDLEQIITKDQMGNEEIFFTDPANSNFYYLGDNYYLDWAFYPGRHMIGFHYPHFSVGFAPYWDWDMDGIPNWMDRHPFWWDPWDAWMCDPWHHHGWGWHNNWWVGSYYWNYWGDGDSHWRHHKDHDNDFQNIVHRISKKQLQDPKNLRDVRSHIRDVIDSRNLRNIFSIEQLKGLEQARKGIFEKDYNLIKKNSNLTIRDREGKEVRMRMGAPKNQPDYTITSPSRMREPDSNITKGQSSTERNIRRDEPRTQPRTQEPGTGTVIKKDSPPPENSGSEPVKKKKDDERSYSLFNNQRSDYSAREAQVYQSRSTSSSTLKPREQPQVRQYSSPRVNYNEIRSNSSRNYTNTRSYSSPNISRSTRSYSSPSISRSSPSRSSSSYRSSGSSNYSRSSSSRSSSSSHSSGSSVRKKN